MASREAAPLFALCFFLIKKKEKGQSVARYSWLLRYLEMSFDLFCLLFRLR
jgi:hypothetical protein